MNADRRLRFRFFAEIVCQTPRGSGCHWSRLVGANADERAPQQVLCPKRPLLGVQCTWIT